MATPCLEESHRFYTQVLGFGQTDYMHFFFNPEPAHPGQGLHFLHTNDKMVSTYVESPAGFALEYGFDGVQIDWQDYTPTESSTTGHWGHRWNQG